jgi:hypothetical protein
MGANVYEGIGCIIISILISIDYYRYRTNPNRQKERFIAYNMRAIVSIVGFFIIGVLLIMGYKVH